MSEGWVGVAQARLKRAVLVTLTTFATERLTASSSALKFPEYTLIRTFGIVDRDLLIQHLLGLHLINV